MLNFKLVVWNHDFNYFAYSRKYLSILSSAVEIANPHLAS